MSFEATNDSKPPSAAATLTADDNDDASEARKMLVLRQLTSVYKFDTEVAERAVAEVGADRSLAVKYILDNELANDPGGSVVFKEDCPHVKHHVKISLEDLPENPNHSLCTYYHHSKEEREGNGESSSSPEQPRRTGQLKAGGDSEDDNDPSCPSGENWICLECGVVRCSRYGKGHSLSHWHDTKEKEGFEEGHCIAASLGDLSVWCHECDAYLHDPLLDPILQRLEQLKFEEVELEPKRKKHRASDSDVSAGLSGDDDDGDDDDDDDDSDGSEISPTIIAVANAVARGVPIELFTQQDEEEEDLEYPFDNLPTSLEEVANFIQSEKCRSIVILAGAGMSVSAGIPDFRSADGLYATMKPDLLTADPVEREAIRQDPTVALEQGMFMQNPLPCLELNREFILGTHSQRWKATLAHRFVELLHAKTGKLARLYTQNIDGLEDQCTQLPRDKVIAVHGSMDRAECANCGQESDFDDFCEKVRTQIKDLSEKDETAPKESSPIVCTNCGYRQMKPAIVLFRSSLPRTFFENAPLDISDADLLIVMGTSLRVAPANSLVWRAPKTALRLLVNREPVGWHLGVSYGENATRDYFAQGDCDHVLLNLMTHLGWLNDLEPLLGEEKLPDKSAALLRKRLGKESEGDDEATSEENS